MSFSDALIYLKIGKKIYRNGWNGKGMYLQLKEVNLEFINLKQLIYLCTTQKDFVPWVASQTDLLSNDWGCDL